tara:strand:+ start:1229 stop:2509 length:1281 start_codon:yes stop_codon:yes gene_type:complete
MASAARASIYEKMFIQKEPNKTADIKGKTTSFDYYESVYSPEVTGSLIFFDAGSSIDASSHQDKQQRKGSIKSSLPLTGYEKLIVKIASKSGTLDFSKNPFTVNGVPTIAQEANRQSVFLPLKSNSTYENLDIKNDCKKYEGPTISATVKSILNDLNIPASKTDIEDTQNNYKFISAATGGLDLITDLCRRSIPKNGGDPGFFFYETQDGFNFKSIDTLISQDAVETYTYNGGLKSNLDNDENDFRILLPPNVIKDQNIEDALKWTNSRNVFFNPHTLEVEDSIYSIKTNPPKQTLGKRVPYTNKLKPKSYSTTNYHVLDIGSLNPTDINPNNDPRAWQAKSPMRYNLLHSQLMEIQVPCNLKLRAGNVIRCEIERQGDSKELGALDEQQSGKYLILHLCHHFDTTRSYTSMTLARDTYGLYVNNK